MQLDRAVSHKLERNGMTVAITAVYDLDTDDSHYEVSKTLTGKELSLSMFHTLAEAMEAYSVLAFEIGASTKDIFYSKVK